MTTGHFRFGDVESGATMLLKVYTSIYHSLKQYFNQLISTIITNYQHYQLLVQNHAIKW